MQTHEWEALLDGTTPGPWREDSDDGILGRRKGEVENWELDPVVGHLHRDSDNTLASVAPEAVAEVVRLRREVAAFRDQMTKSAEWRKAMYDGGDDTVNLLDAEYDRQIAYVLTRILEGEA